MTFGIGKQEKFSDARVLSTSQIWGLVKKQECHIVGEMQLTAVSGVSSANGHDCGRQL